MGNYFMELGANLIITSRKEEVLKEPSSNEKQQQKSREKMFSNFGPG